MHASDFWEAREQVDRFAAREPDRRLMRLIEAYPHPARIRVLDIGCAGGRNTALLAARGFDIHAIDSSRAMVERTRQRVTTIVGEKEAAERIRVGRMEELSSFAAGDFDLVVALGVFHAAATTDQWNAALDEAARVTTPGGSLLVSVFSPRADLTGDGITPVPGEPHVYEGLPSGRHYLVEASELDRALADRGFEPSEATDTVDVEREGGRRVTVNGLYRLTR